MFGLLTREQALRRRVEDALVGLGFAETYTPSLRPDDDTTWKLPEPISVELTALRTTLLPSLVEAARAQRRRRRARGSRCSRSRASTSPAATCRTSASASPGIAEGGFLHVKGVVETLYAALKAEPAFERARAPAAPSRQDRAHARRASSARCTRALLEGEWGAFELDLARALRRRRTSRSPTRT